MRAAQINEYGNKNVLKTVGNAPKPVLKNNQVLVEVYAAGVNPFDWKVREGMVRQMAELHFPATLGGDFAGVISEIGADAEGFSVGEQVYGQASPLSGHGSYAEFVPVNASAVALKPKSVDFTDAAALPLAGVSAYQALVDHAHLQPGQKILIHGGAGGIGTFAIQLAKHLGAYVATTVAAKDMDFVKSLGADKIIDYKTQDFAAGLEDYDVVFDTVGGETNTKSYEVLRPNGVLVSMVAQPNEELMKRYGVTAISQFTQVTTERLAALAKLVDDGVIQPKVERSFPLEDAAEALASIEDGNHRGKVVLTIK